jgi:radical SAM superfamily enzyme YgiQ (UPF0313 family)
MKKAGCRLIKVGVESGVQSILDKSKKGIKIEQSRDLFQWVRRAKITTHAHLMFGMPGEDKNSLEETISFIKKINPNTIDIGICTPYPGSGLFEELSRERPEFKAEAGLDFNNLHTRGLLNRYFANIEDEDLERGLKKAYRSFYLRPSYLARRLGEVKSLSELSDLITAGIKIFNFSLSWKI